MSRFHVSSAVLVLFLCSLLSAAQQQQMVSTNTNVAVPPLINFSGTLTDANGKPLSGTVAVTFSLYSEQTGGAALWMETQNVQPDIHGHYTVMLGSTSSTGLPSDIFVAGQAHWLGVQVEGEAEQPRVLLVSAPYALKAGDAETIGGLPPSAFVLAAPPTAGSADNASSASTAAANNSTSAPPPTTSDVTTTGGTVSTIPAFSTATNIQNSILTQTGTTAINVGGKLNLPSSGTATSTAGFDSRSLNFAASAFNSSTSKAVAETFEWQAQPSGNDTTSPSATLNLLFGSGTTSPAQTGLNIASDGLITFAKGQTFPGTGDGTITGVTTATGSGLSGGGTSGKVTLNLNTSALNSAYAQLGTANTFAGNQTITGELNVTYSGSFAGISVNAPNSLNAISASSSTVGVAGGATAPGGTGTSGVATNGAGVLGNDLATSGASTGVWGISSSTGGIGVYGQATSTSSSSSGVGVYGTAANIGVHGTASNFGLGVEGNGTGIYGFGGDFLGGPSGSVSSTNYPGGMGVEAADGIDTSSVGSGGGLGAIFYGGYSTNGPGGNGVLALAGDGLGQSAGFPIAGVSGNGPYLPGTSGATDGPGIFGSDGTLSSTGSVGLSQDIGVWGDSSLGTGVYATTDDGTALFAKNNANALATLFVQNTSSQSTAPVISAIDGASGGTAFIGGTGCSDTMGLQLGNLDGMSSNCENYTLQGDTSGNTYLNASGSGKIVFRINNGSGPSPMTLSNNGSVSTVTITNLDVTTSFSKPSGTFKIDHPLDPANKYLYHSFVESPDMMNIYNGNITTDSEGFATVTLPDWFEALNKDFRYQLTVIGQFAQAIVASEIESNQFQIRTNLPNVKVSWQVTGIRHDAFADAHRIQTEVEKAPQDRGHYLHPELFGAPETARIGYEAPSKLAPAELKSASASATHPRVVTRRAPMIQRRPLPAPPKLRELKTPTKPTVTQASR